MERCYELYAVFSKKFGSGALTTFPEHAEDRPGNMDELFDVSEG